MKIYAILIASAAVLAAQSATASTVIDFDDGTAGNAIGSFYAGLGVTFANAEFTDNLSLAGTSGTLGARVPGSYWWGVTNPVTGVFSGTVSSVGIRGIDVGAAGIQIDAFDAFNILLGSTAAYGPDVGIGYYFDVSVTAVGIKSFRIYQPAYNGGDGILLENFTFNAVPEPASWALMIVGFGLVGGAVRRQRAQVSGLAA